MPVVLSVSRIAHVLSCSRDTVSRRIAEGHVPPAGRQGGHDVYDLRAVIHAMGAPAGGGVLDPDTLDPFKRRAFYQGEHDKLRLQVARGELVPRDEVEQDQARVAKIVAHFFDTLPDVIERDCGASPLILAKLEQCLDRVREYLHDEVIGDD
jgi:hypothetical protein